jgi:MYXO-CTERM domain-containing protein
LVRRAPQSPLARRSFHISSAYFTLCVAAASASTRPNGFFYAGVALLILLALASVRPRRVSLPAWIVLAALVAGAGQIGHQQLRLLQNALEGRLGSLLSQFFRQPPDLRECRTKIGQPGRIQLSGSIILRVRAGPAAAPPSLFREAAYDSYKNGTWWAGSNDFAPLLTPNASGSIRLLPPKNVFAEVEIASYFDGGEGPLALPHGTFEIDDLPANLRTNHLGVASVDGAPGVVIFRARYGGGLSLDSPPGPDDLKVAEDEKPVLDEVAGGLKLDTLPERQRIRAVSRFFREGFVYTLDLPPRNNKKTALAQFLTESRAGHCEYFASATVLLLRQAGVNARYVTGYLVPESARRGDTYLVRECHRHAWALVYHSDTRLWEQVDNTPFTLDPAQQWRPPWWEPVSDFFSNLFFQFSKWRWSKTSFARYAEWLLAPLILYLIWRILTTRRRQRSPLSTAPATPEPVWPGLDSELYLIDRRLSGSRLSRLPNEPLAQWQTRLEEAWPDSPGLPRIFHLHRRLRFDPRGLESRDREVLKREAAAWLAQWAAASEPLAPGKGRD